MLKTANQRIAALVLVGGMVSLVALLLLAFTLPQMHPDLVMTWLTTNILFVSELTDGAFYEPDSFLEPYTNAAIVTMTAFILSHLLGLFLALRVLLKGWREVRGIRVFLTLNRLSAALVLVSGAIAVGCLAWYMSTCTWYMSFCKLRLKTGLPLAWLNIHYIASSQFSEAIDSPLSFFDQTIIRAANVVMAALAFSYALCVALAVRTLWEWRQPVASNGLPNTS